MQAQVAQSELVLTGRAGEGRYPARSPLRYPGGKSRAVKTLLPLIPTAMDIASPFIGGGSVEIALTQRGQAVKGYDAYKPLVAFWKEALTRPFTLAAEVIKLYPMTRSEFVRLQRKMPGTKDRRRLAAEYVALNRSSFSGTTMSGGMSPGTPRFTETCIDRLAAFYCPRLEVEEGDFMETIARHENDWIYADPPYALRNGNCLYGERGELHKGFDHEALGRILMARDGWTLSYNDCEMVRDLYKGCKFTAAAWTYGMSRTKTSNEVVIQRG